MGSSSPVTPAGFAGYAGMQPFSSSIGSRNEIGSKLRAHFALPAVALACLGALAACNRNDNKTTAQSESTAAQQPAIVTHDSSRPLELTVTSDGFVPAQVKVEAGKPLTLWVTRKADPTCATEIVIKDYGINKPLPLNERVEVVFTPKPGKIRYACAMDMIAGELIAQ
ncbi:MAG TPA: cupredoxin domain-containing protein [Polyangiaceae bacterium]|nr:cupredoxin domain-containing protein [Polyangiaceae bacterium]